MTISLNDVSKRYAYEWVFKNINFEISQNQKLGVVGPNGSGKSTFLKLILGVIDPSKGKVNYTVDGKKQNVGNVYNHISFTAPYMNIIEDFTALEFLNFHFKLKKSIDLIDEKDILKASFLSPHKHKPIKMFSSGMKQRLKLMTAFATDSKMLILDEPTTNLDDEGKEWFQSLLSQYLGDRTLIIATNESDDLVHVQDKINILDYK